jgi:putative N6-adenine-specific DNA methylase
MVAKTFYGLEGVLADELEALGAGDLETQHRAVKFTGNMELMYRANLALRTALRILKPIYVFKAKHENVLYRKVGEVDWSEYLDVNQTFAIDSVVRSHHFNHSKYVSYKVKDAIADQFRHKTGTRPSVDVENPTVRINVFLYNDVCTLSLDSSGDSLHKRGYRLEKNLAPLNEVLAAGMILLTGWDREGHFIDPMCGSGTIPIEAALLAYNIAPGKNRKEFGFQRWKDYDKKLWERIYREETGKEKDFTHKIMGSDISGKSIDMARENAKRAGVFSKIAFRVQSLERLTPPEEGGLVIMNPPYDKRIRQEDVTEFYKKVGDALKQNFSGYDAWILSANREGLKSVGLRASEKVTLYNGALECKFQKYSLYRGTRKQKKMKDEQS